MQFPNLEIKHSHDRAGAGGGGMRQEQEIRSSGETGGWGMWQITAFDPNDAAFRCLKHSAAITWGKRRRCWFLFEGTMPPETGALDQ